MSSVWQFISWTLDFWRSKPQQRPPEGLLAERGPAVVALQEVHGERAKVLKASYPVSVFSQEIHAGAKWSWSGCALLFSEGTTILDKGVVAELPKPQRSVWATVQSLDQGIITFVSWHTPTASGDGVGVKMAAYRVMSDWLQAHPHPLVLGADLNTWRDSVDLMLPDPADDFFEEHDFVGAEPRHRLADADRDCFNGTGVSMIYGARVLRVR